MPDFGSILGGISPTLLVGVLAVLLLVCFGLYLRELGLRRSLASEIARVGEDTGRILEKPSLSFSDIPSELQGLKRDVGKLLADMDDLERRAATALSKAGDGELHATAAARALEAARVGFDAMARHGDGQALAESLGLPDSLAALENVLIEVAAAEDPEERIVHELVGGTLNALFTTGLVIEAYFEDEDAFAPVRLALASARASAELMLAARGVRVRVARPLSRLPTNTPGAHAFDTRNIRNVESVRGRVRRVARTLVQGESLVVDCHTPGWISRSHGDVPPRFAVYDAGAWA